MPIAGLATLASNSSLAGTTLAMGGAGLVVLAVAALRALGPCSRARGLDKLLTLGNLCFAVPLGVFGALHLFGPQFVGDLVPPYMPWRAFWVYAVGAALLAAALSFATDTMVRWSGLLFGVMMFSFVAMIHLPGALAASHDRVAWTIVFRETAFGGAAWLLAATAPDGWQGNAKAFLTAVGRVAVVLALVVFGLEHFLHPTVLPGVPLQQELPAWLPGRALIGYLTGTALLLAGVSTLLGTQARTAGTLLGAWLLVLVVAVYIPFLAVSLAAPEVAVQVQGLNYLADTLLFAGVVLALANAAPAPKQPHDA